MKAGSVTVKVGDKASKGQTIGVVGTTGRSTGRHLHLGIKTNSTAYNNGEWVNPLDYLTGAKSIGIAKQSPAPTKPQEKPKGSTGTYKVGDKVKIKSGVLKERYPTFDGNKFRMWHQIYEVTQVRRDGAIVIGVDGVVTAAVNAQILEKG